MRVDCEASKSIKGLGYLSVAFVKFMMVPPFFVFLHWLLLLFNRVRKVDQKENNENGGTDQSKSSDVRLSSSP